jgi:hypothetical protein
MHVLRTGTRQTCRKCEASPIATAAATSATTTAAIPATSASAPAPKAYRPTVSGHESAEVVSALQKCIRRGQVVLLGPRARARLKANFHEGRISVDDFAVHDRPVALAQCRAAAEKVEPAQLVGRDELSTRRRLHAWLRGRRCRAGRQLKRKRAARDIAKVPARSTIRHARFPSEKCVDRAHDDVRV